MGTKKSSYHLIPKIEITATIIIIKTFKSLGIWKCSFPLLPSFLLSSLSCWWVCVCVLERVCSWSPTCREIRNCRNFSWSSLILCLFSSHFTTPPRPPAMQEEALKLVLLALEDGSALSRKVLVLFVVQRLEPRFPQASKTSIGHVVQLLYRASCFKV